MTYSGFPNLEALRRRREAAKDERDRVDPRVDEYSAAVLEHGGIRITRQGEGDVEIILQPSGEVILYTDVPDIMTGPQSLKSAILWAISSRAYLNEYGEPGFGGDYYGLKKRDRGW